MKKLLLVSVIVLFALTINAQVKFGLKAGLNIANQKFTSSGITISGDSKIGFMAGAFLEAGSPNFVFQPGVLFSQKGMKMSQGGSTAKLTLNYLDVPLNLVYKINASEDVKVLLLAGPTISFGLSGKGKIGSEETDIKFGSGNDADYKSMDLGLSIGGGIEVSSFQLGLNYTFGLSNTSNDSNITAKNNVLTFSVGILFGGK